MPPSPSIVVVVLVGVEIKKVFNRTASSSFRPLDKCIRYRRRQLIINIIQSTIITATIIMLTIIVIGMSTRKKTERSELAEGSYPVPPTSHPGLLTHPPPSQPRVRHITQQMIIISSNSDNPRKLHSYRGSFDQMDIQIDGHIG
jgi:hypothetical protein